MRKALIVAAICAVAALAAPPARAFCPSLTPMANLNATGIIHCPDGRPVSGYAYQISSPTLVNTGLTDIVCEANDGIKCTTMPGSNDPNDNIVGIETDWGNATIVGCPTPNRVMIVLQCADGSGGLISVSGLCPEYGYNPEVAYPFDSGTGGFAPLDMGLAADTNPFPNVVMNNGRPRVMQFSRAGGMDQVMFQVDPPTVQSDCSVGSVGEALVQFGVCADLGCGSFAPSLERGGVYTSTQPCGPGTRPDVRRQNSCTAGTNPVGTLCTVASNCGTGGVCSPPPFPWNPATIDGTGHGMVALTTATNGNCNYVGTTTKINAVESNLITGFLEVGSATAASPVAEGLRVGKKGNSVEVNFKTSSELGLAGFNIYAVGKAKAEIKLNSGLVAAKGVGGSGASYSLPFGIGEFKGNRSVVVESVMTDGSTLRAPKVDF